jgi:hypothetical protein
MADAYDHHTAQGPIPRENIPTMGEWMRMRHDRPNERASLFARLFGRRP